MKSKLQKLEARIQELIEIHMVGLLPGGITESAITQKLAEALHQNTLEKDGKRIAPNVFTLILNPAETTPWQDAQLLDALTESLQAAGREIELEFDSPLTLSVSSDTSLPPGNIYVITSHKIDVLESTHAMPQDQTTTTEEDPSPENAFLIIEGRKVFPLTDSVITMGRRLENQLVIDDPRVSRTHAQLRSIKGRYVIFDLNSTGGTFVNGQRASQTVLYPGDVISLAGVSLVFGQDNPPPRPDLKDTGPLSAQPVERTTAVLKTRSEIRKNKQ